LGKPPILHVKENSPFGPVRFQACGLLHVAFSRLGPGLERMLVAPRTSTILNPARATSVEGVKTPSLLKSANKMPEYFAIYG
jgi:hypothetical protein